MDQGSWLPLALDWWNAGASLTALILAVLSRRPRRVTVIATVTVPPFQPRGGSSASA